MYSALQPLMEPITEAVGEFAKGGADAFSGLSDAGDDQDGTRNERLPESIREARDATSSVSRRGTPSGGTITPTTSSSLHDDIRLPQPFSASLPTGCAWIDANT